MKSTSGKRRRPLPAALTKPIEYTAVQLLDVVTPPLLDSSANSLSRPVPDWLMSQLIERLDALYAHYDINKSGSGSLVLLVLAMAAERYPGFRFRPKGQSGRGRKTTRTIADQVELWVLMKGLMDTGEKAASAATIIRDKFSSIARGCSAEAIEARYYEADRAVQRIKRGEITDFEAMELLMRRYGIPSEP